ncbi:MAG: tRNA (cytidine(34)-2'-O)-methyltransferase [Desulfobacterales bacterium]|jgi:tRNA (cytidine/uridine-2'-O-)-methyltransferase|nr:tRNA (cytidine(34)-2'-O)-methyltransferase [Desulfobacterales bacterium]
MAPSSYQSPEPAMQRHVVLIAPEIHWNTGNIGRTCLGGGARLHLIEPLGFSLDHKQVKRAGLDYWRHVNPGIWPDFDTFVRHLSVMKEEVVLFSKIGTKPFWAMPSPQRLFLIFGSETKGLPATILSRYPDRSYYIPITSAIRSLNLSTAVGISLYESMRTCAPLHAYVTTDAPVIP